MRLMPRSARPLPWSIRIGRGQSRLASTSNATAFPDVAAALAWKPDAAIVATPPKFHLGIAGELVAAGVPVLIEKPISPVARWRRCLTRSSGEEAGRAGLCRLQHAFPSRSGDVEIGICRESAGRYLHLRTMAVTCRHAAGRDYRTLYAARRADGGGVIFDSIHEIEYLAWLLGQVSMSPVKRTALAVSKSKPKTMQS